MSEPYLEAWGMPGQLVHRPHGFAVYVDPESRDTTANPSLHLGDLRPFYNDGREMWAPTIATTAGPPSPDDPQQRPTEVPAWQPLGGLEPAYRAEDAALAMVNAWAQARDGARAAAEAARVEAEEAQAELQAQRDAQLAEDAEFEAQTEGIEQSAAAGRTGEPATTEPEPAQHEQTGEPATEPEPAQHEQTGEPAAEPSPEEQG